MRMTGGEEWLIGENVDKDDEALCIIIVEENILTQRLN